VTQQKSFARAKGQKRLIKKHCEICFLKNKKVLNLHHIIPRCDSRCTDNNSNLAVVCSNCHDLIHVGDIIIIGVYQTSNGREVLNFKKGEKPPLEEDLWLIKGNDLVITR
jgi:hypothetical protein